MKTKLNLLILEDSPDDVELEIQELKRKGFEIDYVCVDNEEDFKTGIANKPNMILVDCSIATFDCQDVLEIDRKGIPLIIVSGTIGEEFAVECMRAGATDYVLKNNLDRLGTVVKRALDEVQTYKRSRESEKALKKRTEELQAALEGVVSSLTATVEYRDKYTAGHQQRTANLAEVIAKEMGLGKNISTSVYIAGMLHDIGKIAIPVEILNKPDLLNKAEFEIVKEHPKVGYNILKSIKFPWPVAEIVLQHHERMDGSGYPKGLKSNDIMIEAKILGVADTVEAMTFRRPYRAAIGIDGALREINFNKNKIYDPEVVDICSKVFENEIFKFD